MFGPQDRWVVISTGLGTGMGYIGLSSLVVALPQMQADLGVDGAGLLWVTNIYQLMLASLLIVGGSLGDVIGHRRTFALGVVVFTLGSAASGLAGSLAAMLSTRAVQGLGGALMIPGALAVLTSHFSDEQRHRAIGLYSTLSISMSLLGPVLGGLLAAQGYWRGVFFINLPIAAFTLFCLTRFSARRTPHRLLREVDWLGALLLILGLGATVYSFIAMGHSGISATNLLLASSGVAGVGLFIRWEQHTANPMIPLYLFRSPLFTATNITQFLLYMAFEASLYFFTLNLIQIQRYTELEAGLAALPYVLALIAMAFAVATISERVGVRRLVTGGAVLVGVGILLITRVGLTSGADAYWSTYFVPVLLIGVGMGVTVVPLDTTMMGSVPLSHTGSASGIDNANVRVASLFAIALLGGIGLSVYNTALISRTHDLGLSAEVLGALAQQSRELGNAVVPASAPPARVAPIETALRLAFVDMFRVIAGCSAALAFLSGGIAWATLGGDVIAARRKVEAAQGTNIPGGES